MIKSLFVIVAQTQKKRKVINESQSRTEKVYNVTRLNIIIWCSVFCFSFLNRKTPLPINNQILLLQTENNFRCFYFWLALLGVNVNFLVLVFAERKYCTRSAITKQLIYYQLLYFVLDNNLLGALPNMQSEQCYQNSDEDKTAWANLLPHLSVFTSK